MENMEGNVPQNTGKEAYEFEDDFATFEKRLEFETGELMAAFDAEDTKKVDELWSKVTDYLTDEGGRIKEKYEAFLSEFKKLETDMPKLTSGELNLQEVEELRERARKTEPVSLDTSKRYQYVMNKVTEIFNKKRDLDTKIFKSEVGGMLDTINKRLDQ